MPLLAPPTSLISHSDWLMFIPVLFTHPPSDHATQFSGNVLLYALIGFYVKSTMPRLDSVLTALCSDWIQCEQLYDQIGFYVNSSML